MVAHALRGIVIALALISFQSTKSSEPRSDPEGWKRVTCKDGTCDFLFPEVFKSSGYEDRSWNRTGFKAKLWVHDCQMRDGTIFEVNSAYMSGSSLKGMKIGEVYDILIGFEKDRGFKVGEPKETKLGDTKAREYRLSKDTKFRRMIIAVTKNHYHTLNVSSTDEKRLDDNPANTFIQSFAFVSRDSVDGRDKDANAAKAAQDEQAGKAMMEKYGVKWTMDLKEMTPPDAPAVGMIGGKEFRPDSIKFQSSKLVFKLGKEAGADHEMTLHTWLKPNDSIENFTCEVSPTGRSKSNTPFVSIAAPVKDRKVPYHQSFLDKYAMKLSMGAKNAEGVIPGKIYVCLPDDNHSFFAGTFSVKPK